ncbi:MAG: 1-(5-phosphoribosyl)-5-[(5-phosphoribosylamino)methylideneamino]imidazole-4-carboxamide isomerase [Pseudomonadota bacterium]|nr:1-(5-phosphoribosyl)-5-[(5-phosphoribosylamino)methylideneamino]imidazole-4-carboxamide isomerase [Pseudomonadota bacterium]
MEVIPAIDLIKGKVVRLYKGDFEKVTEYKDSPFEIASSYEQTGINSLHIVDLDGARTGISKNLEVITEISSAVGLSVQVGGGIRQLDQARAVIGAGADRVVIGSTAAKDPDLVIRWLGELGTDAVIIGADVDINENSEPIIRTDGWTKDSDYSLWQLMDTYMHAGAKNFLCTDISKDGTLKGPNTNLYINCVERFPNAKIIASGGVSSASDLIALKDTRVSSVVTGKALLDGRLTLKEIELFLQNV